MMVEVYKRLYAARIESRIGGRLTLLCAIVLIVLPIHLYKCSENNITQRSAVKAATKDATCNEVRVVDRMVAISQKCPTATTEIIMAAFRYGTIFDIQPELLLAIAYVESSFNPLARSKSSIGLMGINYRVWRKELSLEFNRLYEVDYNMGKGALILRRYITKSGDVWKGVFMYVNGYRGQNMAYLPKVRAMYKKLGGEK